MTSVDRPIIALDLDQTLIYSPNAVGDTCDDLVWVENFDGKPFARMTKQAWRLLGELQQVAEVVPVTTRTREQYERVSLPQTPRYALCANGGTLLCDGVPDAAWATGTNAALENCAPLKDALSVLSRASDREWVKVVKTADSLFAYLVATQRTLIPTGFTPETGRLLEPLKWTVSLQGRKVYAIPRGLSKGEALQRLVTMINPDRRAPVFAAGDSVTDMPMLTFADKAMRPAHGELHEQGWTHDTVHVTHTSGVVAGEEMLRRLTSWVAS